ncbi:MAG: 2Fe-2S iron-sulfur cluster-binding protein [Putridiphycobacter sp.]
MSTDFYKLKINEVVKETADTVSISFEIPNDLREKFSYTAGQYLTLRTTLNGEEVRRAYSLSTAPDEQKWRVAIKQIKNGKFSTFAQSLKVGDELEVMAPTGNFTVTSTDAKTYVLIAAGSGITPIISIAKFLSKANPANNITLFYGNKTEADTVYRAELDALTQANNNLSVVYLYTRQEMANPLLKGRLNTEKISALYEAYLSDKTIDDVHICGPEEMIMSAKDFFVSKGIDSKKIHFELFNVEEPKEKATANTSEVMSQVTVIVDDEEFEFELSSKGKNILQAAQDEDADVPFSCKGGVCCTCKAKVMEGHAVMDMNYSLEPDEVEDGFILTCQAHPTTEKLVVSFDEY